MALAQTQYVRSAGTDIAYQVIGEGPRDIVVALDWASHLETLAEQPFIAEWFTSLSRFARVLWFDMRGVGMSGPLGEESPIEAWTHDLVALMGASGSARASLVAHGYGAMLALTAAATHPERVDSLVIVNGYARFARGDDYPAGLPQRMHEPYLDAIERQWGTGVHALGLGPSVVHRPGVLEWWGRVERYGACPQVAREQLEAILALDVRDALPLVNVPTLVIHSRDNVFARVGHGRYIAEHIRGARWLERDSADHWPVPEPDLVGAIEEFVTGSRTTGSDSDRVLATVMFADIVGSTDFAAELGDRTWGFALERFDQIVHTTLAAFEGVLESTAGDGILATFDGPARAIRCAWRLREELRHSGLEVRCGIHTGEVTRRSDGVAGIAVHIGARVAALSDPGEVLVTRTVRDLVAGSGISFEERGEHELRGVPDRWPLYAATS
ncbi:MAG TPA: adenylate/guanylate cyclase domain-containing protein [Gaiellaceae bacterium]|nr:adenylate/guanylate cyclase domain-containing protein [Gaiellaceae bacterium]